MQKKLASSFPQTAVKIITSTESRRKDETSPTDRAFCPLYIAFLSATPESRTDTLLPSFLLFEKKKKKIGSPLLFLQKHLATFCKKSSCAKKTDFCVLRHFSFFSQLFFLLPGLSDFMNRFFTTGAEVARGWRGTLANDEAMAVTVRCLQSSERRALSGDETHRKGSVLHEQ